MKKEVDNCFDSKDLSICFNNLGIKEGDCLFIHSALRSLGKYIPEKNENILEALFNTLFDIIKKSGTIVVPSFNFKFCEGEDFDLQNTPGEQMGAFSEFIRTNPESLRSLHPFHSVSAVGGQSKLICNAVGYSEFSEGSFFDTLVKLNCKILFIGIDFVQTWAHYSEEKTKVPYRFWKQFSGNFINNNKLQNMTCNFYARNMDEENEPDIDDDKVNNYLREKKIIISKNLALNQISICSSLEFTNELTKMLQIDPYFLLKK